MLKKLDKNLQDGALVLGDLQGERPLFFLGDKQGGSPEWHLLKLLWMTMFSDAGSGERAWLS